MSATRPSKIPCDHKAPNSCADCGQPAAPLTQAYNRLTQSEVCLCPSCIVWHDQQMDEKFPAGSWGVSRQRLAS
jgi:hypothetical protein